MGRIMYTMVKHQTEYNDALGLDEQTKILKRKLKRTQKELDKLQKQLKDCEEGT